MRRRLFTTLSALSLLLCVAVCVLWVKVGDRKEAVALARIDNPEGTARGFYPRLLLALTPYWLVVLATGVLPTAWFTTYALNSREKGRLRGVSSGLCPACGYDLRATPHRCPECGREPSAPVAPATV